MDTHYRVEKFTPQRAQKILDTKNHGNRKLRRVAVNKYARDMIAGRWVSDHAAGHLVFNEETGNIIDGQHRLAAVVQADVTITFTVVHTSNEMVHEVLDVGVKRNFSDLLHWKGETVTTQLGSCIRLGYRWQNSLLFGQYETPSNAELLDWYQHNPSIRRHLYFGQKLYKSIGISTSVTPTFLHRIYQIDEEEAKLFFKALDSGADLDEGDPVLAMRNWSTNHSRNSFGKPRQEIALAVLVKAWNIYIKGDSISNMHFKRGGAVRETIQPLLDVEARPTKLKNELSTPVSLPVPRPWESE